MLFASGSSVASVNMWKFIKGVEMPEGKKIKMGDDERKERNIYRVRSDEAS